MQDRRLESRPGFSCTLPESYASVYCWLFFYNPSLLVMPMLVWSRYADTVLIHRYVGCQADVVPRYVLCERFAAYDYLYSPLYDDLEVWTL